MSHPVIMTLLRGYNPWVMVLNINKSTALHIAQVAKNHFMTPREYNFDFDFLHGWVKRNFHEIFMCSHIKGEGRKDKKHSSKKCLNIELKVILFKH